MHIRRRLALVMLVAVLASIFPVASFAAAGPSGDFEGSIAPVELVQLVEQLKAAGDEAPALWDKLTAEQQELVLKYSQVAEVVTEAVDVPAPVVTPDDISGSGADAVLGCAELTVKRWGNNAFGNRLWTYYESVYRCWNGSTVYNVSRNRWGTVSWVFWYFRGHIGSYTQGGNGYTYYRAWTQGHFEYCPFYIGCGTQNAYPWINIYVYNNGTYSYSTGG